MGIEEIGDSRKWGLRRTPIHKRSKSFPGKEDDGVCDEVINRIKLDVGELKNKMKSETKQSQKAKVEKTLKEEILHLEKRLQDQFKVRHALEAALGYKTDSHDNTTEPPMPKPATELIKEIAVLEYEVVYLEQYLLSLYRKALDQQKSPVSPSRNDGKAKSPLIASPQIIGRDEKIMDDNINRCRSSLQQNLSFSSRIPLQEECLSKGVWSCHSQPLPTTEYAENEPTIISLAEHLGTCISDHVPVSPNKLSEDMIKCMASIYSKLAEPPSRNNDLSSPNSSVSSVFVLSPRDQCDIWSQRFGNNSSFDVRLDNPFHIQGLKEFSGPYSTMVEVSCIYRDTQRLSDVEYLLQNFRSLVSRLEEVDPRKLKHEEKLAFWINIHNALVMHAVLAYGIPQNSLRRLYLLLKAAYNIGGRTISANVMQGIIMGCRMSRPSQWIRLFLSSKTKFKTGDERQAYAIDHPEPRLHFALSSGNHSDPAVRIYTPKRVIQQLEIAKEEYIRATFGISKDRKMILPKVVESFAKDSGLCQAGIIEMIQQSLPESMKKTVKKCQLEKSRKNIEWIPHNFTFRYLISKELLL